MRKDLRAVLFEDKRGVSNNVNVNPPQLCSSVLEKSAASYILHASSFRESLDCGEDSEVQTRQNASRGAQMSTLSEKSKAKLNLKYSHFFEAAAEEESFDRSVSAVKGIAEIISSNQQPLPPPLQEGSSRKLINDRQRVVPLPIDRARSVSSVGVPDAMLPRRSKLKLEDLDSFAVTRLAPSQHQNNDEEESDFPAKLHSMQVNLRSIDAYKISLHSISSTPHDAKSHCGQPRKGGINDEFNRTGTGFSLQLTGNEESEISELSASPSLHCSNLHKQHQLQLNRSKRSVSSSTGQQKSKENDVIHYRSKQVNDLIESLTSQHPLTAAAASAVTGQKQIREQFERQRIRFYDQHLPSQMQIMKSPFNLLKHKLNARRKFDVQTCIADLNQSLRSSVFR